MSIASPEQIELFRKLTHLGHREKRPLFLVGGFVRDVLLGHSIDDKDIDLIVEGNAIEFVEQCREDLRGEIKLFPDFYTAKVIKPQISSVVDEIDFASSRTESYPTPGHLPVVSLAPIGEDLSRRDFTINALAVPLENFLNWVSSSNPDLKDLRPLIIDKFGGLKDLDSKVIRILHEKSFRDDPTRIYRACRYAARIAGSLESGTSTLLHGAVKDRVLDTVSTFRRFNELKKIISEINLKHALELLRSNGVFESSPICEPENIDVMIARMSLLSKIPPEARFDSFLSLVHQNSKPDRWHALSKELNLGKKRVREIESSEPLR